MTGAHPGTPPDVLDSEPPEGGPRRPRATGWVGALLACAALLGLARLTAPDRPDATPTPSPSGAVAPSQRPIPTPDLGQVPRRGTGPPLPAASGPVAGLALTRSGLYVVQVDPPRLLRLDHAGRRVAAVPTLPGASGVTADPAHRLIWVWANDRDRGAARGYAVPSLRQVAAITVQHRVWAAAGYGGRLWLATERGMVALEPGAQSPTTTSGWRGPAVAVAADPPRRRVLTAWSGDGGTVLAAGPRPPRGPAAEAVLKVFQFSIAVVGDDVWVAGFGNEGPVIAHLNAQLRPAGAPPPPLLADGPGAVVWPGRSVVWLRDGGATTLTCVDARTGRELARWDGIIGPVTSLPGVAFAGTGGGVVRLSLGDGCHG